MGSCTVFLKSLSFVTFLSFYLSFFSCYWHKDRVYWEKFLLVSLMLSLEQWRNSFSNIWHSEVIWETWFWICVCMFMHAQTFHFNCVINWNHQFTLNLEISFSEHTDLAQVQCCIWVQQMYFLYARFLVVVWWSEPQILKKERGEYDQV